jgi:hypothetical protein
LRKVLVVAPLDRNFAATSRDTLYDKSSADRRGSSISGKGKIIIRRYCIRETGATQSCATRDPSFVTA